MNNSNYPFCCITRSSRRISRMSALGIVSPPAPPLLLFPLCLFRNRLRGLCLDGLRSLGAKYVSKSSMDMSSDSSSFSSFGSVLVTSSATSSVLWWPWLPSVEPPLKCDVVRRSDIAGSGAGGLFRSTPPLVLPPLVPPPPTSRCLSRRDAALSIIPKPRKPSVKNTKKENF